MQNKKLIFEIIINSYAEQQLINELPNINMKITGKQLQSYLFYYFFSRVRATYSGQLLMGGRTRVSTIHGPKQRILALKGLWHKGERSWEMSDAQRAAYLAHLIGTWLRLLCYHLRLILRSGERPSPDAQTCMAFLARILNPLTPRITQMSPFTEISILF